MEEMIKQIAQIDAVAVSNREDSERVLRERRQRYETEMQAYRDAKLQKAHKQAETIYNQIVQTGEMRHSEETKKSKEVTLLTQERYLSIEPTLLNEVFSELFRVEG